MLRLLADDLTGALDSASAFGSSQAPVPVRWQERDLPAGAIAFDSGTREAAPDEARARVRTLAPLLWADPSVLAYKKIDSLLRGSEAEEIGAILDACRFDHCILAPAFPAQRRVTRGGRQFVFGEAGGWQAVPTDLAADLAGPGRPLALASPGARVPPGLSVWDAESDADLDGIVRAAAGLGRVLWVGSGGLAAALARRFGPRFGPRGDTRAPELARPVLGLFGSDHPAMRAQLAQAADWHEPIGEAGEDGGRLERLLVGRGVVFASVSLPPGLPRDAAADRIEAVLGALVRRLDRPGTLVVAGGETLRRLCDALEADELGVTGEIMPGIARSLVRGGRWNGTAVVSKSGAFGPSDLLSNLIAGQAARLHGA